MGNQNLVPISAWRRIGHKPSYTHTTNNSDAYIVC